MHPLLSFTHLRVYSFIHSFTQWIRSFLFIVTSHKLLLKIIPQLRIGPSASDGNHQRTTSSLPAKSGCTALDVASSVGHHSSIQEPPAASSGAAPQPCGGLGKWTTVAHSFSTVLWTPSLCCLLGSGVNGSTGDSTSWYLVWCESTRCHLSLCPNNWKSFGKRRTLTVLLLKQLWLTHHFNLCKEVLWPAPWSKFSSSSLSEWATKHIVFAETSTAAFFLVSDNSLSSDAFKCFHQGGKRSTLLAPGLPSPRGVNPFRHFLQKPKRPEWSLLVFQKFSLTCKC